MELLNALKELSINLVVVIMCIAELLVRIVPYFIGIIFVGNFISSIYEKKALAKSYGQQKVYVYYNKKNRNKQGGK